MHISKAANFPLPSLWSSLRNAFESHSILATPCKVLGLFVLMGTFLKKMLTISTTRALIMMLVIQIWNQTAMTMEKIIGFRKVRGPL
jgi:hypothetical protein